MPTRDLTDQQIEEKKERKRAYHRAWYAANKERGRNYSRKNRTKPGRKEKAAASFKVWYANGGKEIRANTFEKWRKENREYNTTRKAEWRKENAERVAEYGREYREADHEYHITRNREWRRKNTDKTSAIYQNYRSRKRNAEGTYTAEDIAVIRLQQNDCCAAPHCRVPLKGRGSVDHIQPLSKGGTNWPSNLQMLCRPCNAGKNARNMEEWLEARIPDNQRKQKSSGGEYNSKYQSNDNTT